MPEQEKPKRRPNGTPIAKYPKTLLRQIDRWVLSDMGAIKIVGQLIKYYGDQIVPPSYNTMHAYVVKRRQQITEDLELRLELEALSLDHDLTRLNPKDSLDWVDHLLLLNAELMQSNMQRNRGVGDTRFDKIVADVSNNTAALLETRMKLEAHGKLMNARLQASIRILGRHLMNGVADAYKKIHGDKRLKDFSDAVGAMIDGLDVEAIEEELNEATGGGKKHG